MVKDYLWRQRVKFESTLALSMLEPWEKYQFSLLTMLVMIGLFQYLPQHVMVMQRRAIYYLWGQEGDVFRSWVETPGLKEL
ncbi:hypothetical protein EV702DRAFT_985601 [Suillus placidus]|uniref:Uncharacterized protein n=1 Tax=Suillus placidus TaxID=48579 RepID=A0A9P6ZEW7_9AGAM|nr:hypothetical protein EV702DRAFT_985601 [Suillus placidus]